MDYFLGIIVAMAGIIVTLFKVNSNLRSKNKLKDLEIEDVKLETQQAQIKKEKDKLKKDLKSPTLKESISDKEIEKFWSQRKGDK